MAGWQYNVLGAPTLRRCLGRRLSSSPEFECKPESCREALFAADAVAFGFAAAALAEYKNGDSGLPLRFEKASRPGCSAFY